VSGPADIRILGIPLHIPRLSVGDLTVLVSYYVIVAAAMSQILGSYSALSAARDAVDSLAQLWDEEQEEEADDGKRPLARLAGEVELRGVAFAYAHDDRRALDGLDLHVPAGSSLALVGASGSGKSTIASLVLGFYRPQSGAVLIDGQDLRLLDRRSVRRQMGVVSQDVVLFRDSVLDNIAWGERVPDLERARAAARRANALDFIEALPGGFQHELGDRGAGLSGGQRQRLAIARALYRDPRILVLDEATSALDPESERLVQAALEELMRGRTTLIIAHRLSTVRQAGRIAVLDHGRVVESGTFAELMARDGAFRRLAQGQLA
jgi:ATP-binding cassette subfamily B protein